MCSLSIERKIFIVFAQVLYIKFYNFYNIEVSTTCTGQTLDLDFFVCFAFSLLLLLACRYFFPQYLRVEGKATLQYFFIEIGGKWFQQLSP